MEDQRHLIRQMMHTCKMAAMMIRTHVKYSFDPEDARMAEIITNNILSQVTKAEKELASPEVAAAGMDKYVSWARAATQEMEWIWVPEGARAVRTEGGAYVEVMMHVTDSDVEN